MVMGRPTEYEEWMIEDMLQKSDTMFLEEIASSWGVAAKTVWMWSIDPNKGDFCKAYIRAKDKIIIRLMDKMLSGADNRNFNFKCIEFLINRITGSQDRRAIPIPGLDDDSFEHKVKAVLAQARNGELRTEEVSQLLNALKVAQEITVGVELEKRVEAMEGKIK